MHHQPLIKICGLQEPDLAVKSVAIGVHYVGLMFYEESKRHVKLAKAKAIAEAVHAVGGIVVPVVVKQNADKIIDICKALDTNIVQLHGDAARAASAYLPENIARIYVLHVDKLGNIQADEFFTRAHLNIERDYLLFDSIKGGSGENFNWQQLTNPYKFRFFIAGGLTVVNVKTAVSFCHPDGVDVSSGVESAPGVKDWKKIKEFVCQLQV